MPDSSTPIRPYQLIYTNVEADLSPHRQRGFQVWLWSPELTAEQRRATAKRLDDFRLPAGVTGAAAILERHVFFYLPDGELFVIARTVPSSERDKFGRGGKFHAHALLLKQSDFQTLGCDPFRVIDGGFAFHSTPADAMTQESWRSGTLPEVHLVPSERSTVQTPLPPPRYVELLDHLERGDDRPLVLADRPERVLGVLRSCFAFFPPSVRARLEFDTLSNGASLAQIRYAITGAYSTEHLKLWSFRRYHRLDSVTGTCSPPLANPASPLAGELLTHSDWLTCDDPSRERLMQTIRALERGRWVDLSLEQLTDQDIAVLIGCSSLSAAVDAAIQARIESELDPQLAQLPGVSTEIANYFTGSVLERLSRIREPIPREIVAEALTHYFTRTLAEPGSDTLGVLLNWLATGCRIPRLELIARRWRGQDSDLALIGRELTPREDPSQRSHWFREWVNRTLQQHTPDRLRERLAPHISPEPAMLRDARLWLLLNPQSSPVWDELHYLTALHRGPASLAATLQGSGRSTHAQGWLVKTIKSRLADRFKPGWMNDGPEGHYFGLFLVPHHAVDETLLDAAIELGSPIARRILFALWTVAVRAPSPTGAETERPAPPLLTTAYNTLQSTDPSLIVDRAAKLREAAVMADDESYRWLGNQLLRKVYGQPVLRAVTDDVYFVGLKLIWVQFDKPGHQTATFEAIAGAIVPEYIPEKIPDVGRTLELRPTRRFSWLLARLDDPNGTEGLPI